ncbi:hypothetical protein ACVWW1_004495 [Bradyrhizobium sp. JR3.5]
MARRPRHVLLRVLLNNRLVGRLIKVDPMQARRTGGLCYRFGFYLHQVHRRDADGNPDSEQPAARRNP